MSKVVPSQVVEVIEKTFPTIEQGMDHFYIEIGYAQRLNPGVFFDKLKSPKGFIIGNKQISRQDQGNAGKERTDPFNFPVAPLWKKKNHQKPRHAAQENRRKIWET